MWHGPNFIPRPRNLDTLVLIGEEVAFDSRYLYWEKYALVEALQDWVGLLEDMCGDQHKASL